MTGWPEYPKMHPHPFAKLFRHCVSVLIYFERTSKEAIVPMYFWVKQHILHSLSKLVKGVLKLTSTTFTGVKLAFYSVLRRLKHLHFKNSNTILRDPEIGQNHTLEGTHNAILSEGVSEVDKAVEKYIGSLDKTFAGNFHQTYFRRRMNEWKGVAYVCSFLLGASPLTKHGQYHH